jgi:hypothetical protein
MQSASSSTSQAALMNLVTCTKVFAGFTPEYDPGDR